MKFGTHLSCFSLGCALLLGASAVSAHADLTDPPPRLGGEAGGNQLKIGPCGQMTNARTDTVTDFMGGETITVSFGEYIDHQSYYRIALDVEGDDSFPMRPEESVPPGNDDPAAIHPLSDITDTELEVYILQYYMDDENPGFMNQTEYSTQVTLPNIDCQNCTLQLIQFMYNDPEPHYFQCADITITSVAGDTTTTGGGDTTGGVDTTTGSMGGAGGGGVVFPNTTGNIPNPSTTGASVTAASTSGASTMGSTVGTTSTTGAGTTGVNNAATTGTPATSGATASGASTTGAPVEPSPQAAEDEGGCSCRTAPGVSQGGWLAALIGLGLLGYRRRPRARR